MKRNIVVVIALSANLTATNASWSQQSVAIENALEHSAYALAFQSLCPKLELDTARAGGALAVLGIKLNDPTIEKKLQEMAIEKYRLLAPNGETANCMSGNIFYGPEGVQVRGLLQPR